jgi:hypothetical protein
MGLASSPKARANIQKAKPIGMSVTRKLSQLALVVDLLDDKMIMQDK